MIELTHSRWASYAYDPWGNITSSSGSFANKQPFRYAGYYWDSEAEMYYLINRYYDPKIKRFVSEDPEYDPEDQGLALNAYIYALNNPVMSTDPDGLYPTIMRSSRGDYVRWMQAILVKVGNTYHREYEPNYKSILAPFGADGVFGPRTDQAVRQFQNHHLARPGESLAVDGIVGPKTWGALTWWLNNPGGYGGHNDFYDVRPSQVYGPPSPVRVDITNSFHKTLKRNARIAHHHRWDIPWFLRKVGYHGAPWDYKQILGPSTSYIFLGRNVNGDDLGNINYGYTGTSAAISRQFLLTGAGYANITDNGLKVALKDWSSHFDQPRDQDMVNWGVNLWHGDFGHPFRWYL